MSACGPQEKCEMKRKLVGPGLVFPFEIKKIESISNGNEL